jgi:uncharacterized membrane protein
MSSTKEQWPEGGERVESVAWFGDAIFAFSMTLLAIDIRIPEGVAATDLPAALVSLQPRFIAFLLTFWIVGLYWTAFRRVFSHLVRYDRGMIQYTLLFLMFVVLVPFPTDMLARYQGQVLSLITLSIFYAATGFALGLVWIHASRHHRLVDKDLNPRFIRYLTMQYMLSPLVFLGTIPVFVLVSIYIPFALVYSGFFWFIIVPLRSIVAHKYEQ